MTALAGCWSETRRPDLICGDILDALRPYGRGEPTIRMEGTVAMSVRPWAILKEDRFGPPIIGNARGDLLCADVRLDDREGLAHALGVDARAMPDAALVMAALERWSLAALPRIYGDFALAFWDARARALTLARDFAAQKPLHYHRSAGLLAWSSMPNGLHALPEVPLVPELPDLERFLALEPENG